VDDLDPAPPAATPLPDASTPSNGPDPQMSNPSRRRFLLGAGVSGAAVVVAGGLVWRRSSPSSPSRGESAGFATPSGIAPKDTILVVVQLGGGNDALNTLVPSDGAYLDARPTLGIPESQRLALAGTTAFAAHPALAPVVSWWDQGRLGAVAGVGFVDQTRSHFKALDTWWSGGSTGGAPSGWLGRWLDLTADHDPHNPLRAIALGSGAPALRSQRAAHTVVTSLSSFAVAEPKGLTVSSLAGVRAAMSTAHDGDGPLLAAARRAVPTTLDAVERLSVLRPTNAEEVDAADAPGGATEGSITGLLDTAAGILDLDLGTRVLHVSVSGFDTHADQDSVHTRLLEDLAGGLDRFLAAMADQGRADKVLVLTVSEFGRRVAENGSGTDHGTATTLLLAGAGVAGGRVHGEVDLSAQVDGDVPIAVDGRSVYANALDFLGGGADEVLGGPFDRLGLLG